MAALEIKQYIGEETFRKAQETKWWALARFVDQLIYNGTTKDTDPPSSEKRFQTTARTYVGEMKDSIKILGRDGRYIDTEKGLRELMHECERMAVKEVT
jgi:hypothetical protein